MPNRYIREGLLDSDPLKLAGEAAEVLFVRLVLVADDYGRFDGRVSVIRARCWPLGAPAEGEVETRLAALAKVGMIERYAIGGKAYLTIPKFRQRTRSQASKYPDPPSYVGHPSVNGQTDDGQASDRWRASDSPPQAVSVSRSVSRSGSVVADDGHTLDNGQSTAGQPSDKRQSKASGESRSRPTDGMGRPETATEKTARMVEESRKATQHAVPMPEHVRAYLPAAKVTREPGDDEFERTDS